MNFDPDQLEFEVFFLKKSGFIFLFPKPHVSPGKCSCIGARRRLRAASHKSDGTTLCEIISPCPNVQQPMKWIRITVASVWLRGFF